MSYEGYLLGELEYELIGASMEKVEFEELLMLRIVNNVLRVVLGEMKG